MELAYIAPFSSTPVDSLFIFSLEMMNNSISDILEMVYVLEYQPLIATLDCHPWFWNLIPAEDKLPQNSAKSLLKRPHKRYLFKLTYSLGSNQRIIEKNITIFLHPSRTLIGLNKFCAIGNWRKSCSRKSAPDLTDVAGVGTLFSTQLLQSLIKQNVSRYTFEIIHFWLTLPRDHKTGSHVKSILPTWWIYAEKLKILSTHVHPTPLRTALPDFRTQRASDLKRVFLISLIQYAERCS